MVFTASLIDVQYQKEVEPSLREVAWPETKVLFLSLGQENLQTKMDSDNEI